MFYRRISCIFLIIGLILITGCSTATMGSLSQEEREEIQTATFKAPYNETFSAVLWVFEDEGYFIDNADTETGLITSEWKEGASSFGEELLVGSGVRRKISARLKKIDDKTTRVKLRGLVQTRMGTGWSGTEDDMRVDVVKKSYKKYFDAILQNLTE